MASTVKQEKPDTGKTSDIENLRERTSIAAAINISSSSSSSSVSSSSDDSDIDNSFFVNIRSGLNTKRVLSQFDNGYLFHKKPKLEIPESRTAISPKFLSLFPSPLNFVGPETVVETEPVQDSVPPAADANMNVNCQAAPVLRAFKQFWKAGDYEGVNADDSSINSAGMDHVRVHPKFLHSNATSHKWALGAFAELLDNSLDEVCHGATYVNVDMMKNKKDGSNMLMVEDNGGGMTPDKMRQCMSLGYSAKSKMTSTIGQYGNGFKTSTMRLGADVIVFSCCKGNNRSSMTRSVGLLSYSFLMGTGKQDIVVPMIDYERRGESWNRMIRSSPDDWNRNLDTIVQWSPYKNEEDLLHQFNLLEDQGTRVVIYNLWEDDEGNLELDFDSDQFDIQIRGVNREEKNIEMAKKYPNSRHFLTYRHSLRTYASILYLRLPAGFRIILRGKDVLHHNIINDMMLTKEITYKPLHLPDQVPRDLNMVATVTIGFLKDARHHIDVQGFNVYHKNRLIKPFWRVWNAAGSDGRGAIGVLEANFVEPAHDKQGFERTPVLSRLENRLVAIQKNYWCTYCQEVGYAPRRLSAKKPDSETTESRTSDKDKYSSPSNRSGRDHCRLKTKLLTESDKRSPVSDKISEDGSSHELSPVIGQSQQAPRLQTHETSLNIPRRSRSKAAPVHENGRILYNGDAGSLIKSKEMYGRVFSNGNTASLTTSKEEYHKSIERLATTDDLLRDLQYERDKCTSLENQLQKAQQKIEEMDQEQIALIDMIQEERVRREAVEDRLREKIRDASSTISDLIVKVKRLEERRAPS